MGIHSPNQSSCHRSRARRNVTPLRPTTNQLARTSSCRPRESGTTTAPQG
jgi:hypothetical protein